jgi:hypothetical protein
MPSPITATIEINAPVEEVYKVLTNFPEWEKWNTFIVKAEGDAKIGSRLKLKFNDGMTFTPTVLEANGKELRWLGKLWNIGHLFDGEHRFELTPSSSGGTTLVQSEQFGGIFAWLIIASMGSKIQKNFATLNENLKARVENR